MNRSEFNKECTDYTSFLDCGTRPSIEGAFADPLVFHGVEDGAEVGVAGDEAAGVAMGVVLHEPRHEVDQHLIHLVLVALVHVDHLHLQRYTCLAHLLECNTCKPSLLCSWFTYY